MLRLSIACLAVIASASHARAQTPEYLFYTGTGSLNGEIELGDAATPITIEQIGIYNHLDQTYTTLHDDGYNLCALAETISFGGVHFNDFVTETEGPFGVVVDGLYIDSSDGSVYFSTERGYTAFTLGSGQLIVEDGDVVRVNPRLPTSDPNYIVKIIAEDALFIDIPLVSLQDEIVFSVNHPAGSEARLDDMTEMLRSELAIATATYEPFVFEDLHTYTMVPDTFQLMHDTALSLCQEGTGVFFGGDELFERIGILTELDLDIDAIAVDPKTGHVYFSARQDFIYPGFDSVQDGSVLRYNPFLSLGHPEAVEYAIEERVVLAGNEDIDAFAERAGKFYFSVAGDPGTSVSVNGVSGAIRPGDIVEFDPTTSTGSIYVSADELFVDPAAANIDGISFSRFHELIFSVRGSAILNVATAVELQPGSLGLLDMRTDDPARKLRIYALQRDFFLTSGDIDALHIARSTLRPGCQDTVIDKGMIDNDIDVDAFTIFEGTYYLSIDESHAVLNGHDGEPFLVRDGDIVAYDPLADAAEVLYREFDLFVDPDREGEGDIDALSFNMNDNLVLSFGDVTTDELQGAGFDEPQHNDAIELVGVGDLSLYALGIGELFIALPSTMLQNLGALHIERILDPSCNPLP